MSRSGGSVEFGGLGLAFVQSIEPRGFLGLSLKHGLLNLVTLSAHRFWGQSKVRRRIWGSMGLYGEPLTYVGGGRELFVGFLLIKRPAGWVYDPATSHVSRKTILKKPVFWGIWIAFYINITCGLALISQEKDILHDVLRAFPQYANLSPAKFAAAISGIIGLVLAVDSVFNTAGRVGFSTLSDHLKRRETVYQVIFIMSIAVCLLQIFTSSIGNALLWAVLAMLFLVNAGYGGGFSTLPVLLDQHFGTKTVSTTHGLTLSAWAFAGLSGNQLASFVVAHAPDQAHRYAALIPVLTGLFVVALISISLVKYLGDRNVTKAVEDRG